MNDDLVIVPAKLGKAEDTPSTRRSCRLAAVIAAENRAHYGSLIMGTSSAPSFVLPIAALGLLAASADELGGGERRDDTLPNRYGGLSSTKLTKLTAVWGATEGMEGPVWSVADAI